MTEYFNIKRYSIGVLISLLEGLFHIVDHIFNLIIIIFFLISSQSSSYVNVPTIRIYF